MSSSVIAINWLYSKGLFSFFFYNALIIIFLKILTSLFSYLHRNVSMRFLTCEPNLSKEKNYVDEADIFYNDPLGWLKEEYHRKRIPPPSHIVYFDKLKTEISEFLTQTGYNHCGTFFHTHLPEGRTGNTVLVSCRW